MEKIPMTPSGLAILEDELRRLKAIERPDVIRSIVEAREHGDLSENSEYHAARERQGFVEGRISELEDIISRAEVIDITKLSGPQIRFGATVTLANEDSGEKTTYMIVGAHEADIKHGRISVYSPLGKALIGKRLGDTVEVTIPKGGRSYRIINVKYLFNDGNPS